VPNMYRILY